MSSGIGVSSLFLMLREMAPHGCGRQSASAYTLARDPTVWPAGIGGCRIRKRCLVIGTPSSWCRGPKAEVGKDPVRRSHERATALAQRRSEVGVEGAHLAVPFEAEMWTEMGLPE